FAADEPEPTVVMAAPAESGAPADSEAEPFFVSDAAPAFAPPAAAPTFGLEEEESPAASEPESAVFTPPPFEPPAPEPEPPPEPAPMIEAEAELPTQILPAPPASPSPPPAVMVSSPGASGVRSSLPLIPPPPRTATPREAPASIPAIVMPPPPAASRPSKEDLAALDALLNARTIEGPLEPLERERPASPARNWEPKFAQPQRGHAPERRLSPIVLAAAAFLVLGAGGAGAWFYMKRPDSRTAAASPTTPPRTPATAPTTTLAATATSSPAPAATPGATPAVPSPAPAAAGTPSPVPAATPQQSAKPDVPPAKGGALADARGLMQKGSIPQAAQAFAAHLRSAPSAFSVQILVACSTETVTKAVESVSAPELYVLPVNFKGRDCYRLCWGLYESEARAGGALRSVPDYFRKGGATPKVVPTATLLP
ncbi:MAG: hypothetical protein HY317_05370, partial [Acidobacteria bacterium]|nr:hypothetical protein [Acidobacteriota bacterium]